MKKTRTLKTLIIMMALFLSLGSLFFVFNTSVAKADYNNDFITVKSGKNIAYDQAVEINVATQDTINLRNELVIEDFGIQLVLGAEVSKLDVKFTSKSFYVNGNKKDLEDGKYQLDTSIENVLSLEVGENNVTAKVNGAETGETIAVADGVVTLEVKVVDGYYAYELNGEVVDYTATAYNRIRQKDKASAKIAMDVTASAESKVTVNYIDQKVSDNTGAYKQEFKFLDGEFENYALPRVTLNSTLLTEKILVGRIYEPKITSYSVFNNIVSSNLVVKAGEGANTVRVGDNGENFKCGTKGVYNVNVNYGEKVCETYVFDAINDTPVDASDVTDTEAPKFVAGEALENFKDALAKSLRTTHFVNGQEVEGFITIGTGNDYKLPSMEDIVTDQTTAYSDLKITLHYFTNSSTTESTATKLQFPISTAGKYVFFVCFEDICGNKTVDSDFYKVNEDGIKEPTLGDYVFTFEIYDDSPLSVKKVTQSNGYIGVKYKASAFIINGTGYKTNYKLYYMVGNDAQTNEAIWEEIPSASSITKDSYQSSYFTYEDIQAFGYDGELTFTPSQKGKYMIECNVFSQSYNGKSDSAQSIISVDNDVEYVYASNWFLDNIWSIVFLGIGSLCLIGIIVLIFVKPKEKVAPGTKVKYKKKSKK